MGKGSRNRAVRKEAQNDSRGRELRRAMLREVNAELSRSTDRFFEDEVCVMLWVLRQVFGFGETRLKRFYLRYNYENQKLKKHYEASDSDMPYIAKQMLLNAGIDVDAWDREQTE